MLHAAGGGGGGGSGGRSELKIWGVVKVTSPSQRRRGIYIALTHYTDE